MINNPKYGRFDKIHPANLNFNIRGFIFSDFCYKNLVTFFELQN